MTLRYAHLSPAHKLDAVQRLQRDATGSTARVGGGWTPLPATARNAPGHARNLLPDRLERRYSVVMIHGSARESAGETIAERHRA